MNIQNFKVALFEKARAAGFEKFELYYPSAESFKVNVFGGEIDEFENAYSSGVSFRGIYGGKMGYASTERVEESQIDYLLSAAKANAAVIEDKDIEPLYAGDSKYPAVDAYDETLNQTTASEKCALAKRLEKAALECDKRVVAVDFTALGSFESEIVIANSLGLDVSHRSNGAFAGVMVRVQEGGEEGGDPKVGFEKWAGRNLGGFSPEALAKAAVAKGIAQLGAAKATTGQFATVFNNETAADLFAAFSANFFAENVQKGFSLLAGKLGQKIASPALTIRDDGYIEGGSPAAVLGSKPFDSEGVATKNKAVIENGVLKTFLYNLKAAEKDGVGSTGNGFKRGLTGPMITGCGLFSVQPSDVSFDDVLKMAGDGILITSLDGLHAGVNAVSGDFSLSATGFAISGGLVGAPVDQMVVSGNFYEMIQNVVQVGSDIYYDAPSGEGTFGAPCVYAGCLNISGV